MSDIFQLRLANRPHRDKYKVNLEIPKTNQAKFGTKSLRAFALTLYRTLESWLKTSKHLKES